MPRTLYRRIIFWYCSLSRCFTHSGLLFIFTAYERFELHCLTFVGLQIALYFIALQNSLQMYTADIGYPFLDWMGGGAENRVRNTKRAAIIYMAVLTFVNFGYLGLCGEGIVQGRTNPILLTKIGTTSIGAVLDKGWLFLNAFVALLIAYSRSKHDYPLRIVVGQDVKYYQRVKDEETVPLNKL